MHRSKKSTERCVRLLMSRRLLFSTKPIDGDLSKAATSKAVSDRGEQVKGAFQDYLKKNATRRDGMWSRLGDDGSGAASFEPPRVTNTAAPYTKRDVGSGRIQNQRTLLNRRDSKGNNNFNRTTHRPDTQASKGTAQQKASMKGTSDGNGKRSRGGIGEGQFDDGLDGSVESLLFDNSYFEELFAEGKKSLNYDEMDDVDKLMAYSFQESFKSSTHEATTVVEAPSLKKKVLPRARTMKELYAFMQPDIQSVPEGTPGHSIAVQSWPVIQRNMFYSDKDKYKLLETIAKLYNKVEAHYEEQTSGSKEKEIDLIFRTDFRKGRPFFEEEQRLKALSGEGFTEEVVDEYAQADTDWDVQAVEDEDQL